MNTIRMQMITQLTAEAVGILHRPVTTATQAESIEEAIDALKLALELVRGATTMPRRAADAGAKEALSAIHAMDKTWNAAAAVATVATFDPLSEGCIRGPEDGTAYRVWNGGAQPVETLGKEVKVIFRSRPNSVTAACPAGSLRWSHGISSSDIIGYRVL